MKFQWPIARNKKVDDDFQVKGCVLGSSSELGSFLIFGMSGTGATPQSAFQLYEKSTAVSIPVNMIAEEFASITPVLSDGKKIISKHEILDLLGTPSPFFTQDLFLETLGKNYLVTGEQYTVALGNINRPPLELLPVSPKDLTVQESQSGFASEFLVSGTYLNGNYLLVTKGKTARYLDGNLREIIQARNFSTKNNSLLRGQSPLLAASAEARQHIKGNTHNISLLDNGGRVSLVFHFDEDLGLDEFDELKERVDKQYGGTTKAGSIGVTAGGKLDIKELGINNKDMDFVNLQSTAKTAVAQQYKVPLPLVLVDATTFSNYKEARLALYDNCVLPLADRIFASLTNLVVPRYGLNPAKVKITYDVDQIPALIMRRNEELKTRKELNLESTDELREYIGKGTVPGGDEILVQSSMIPISQSSLDSVPDKPAPRVLRDDDATVGADSNEDDDIEDEADAGESPE